MASGCPLAAEDEGDAFGGSDASGSDEEDEGEDGEEESDGGASDYQPSD